MLVQIAIIEAAAGYADGNSNWQQSRNQAHQFVLREALKLQALNQHNAAFIDR